MRQKTREVCQTVWENIKCFWHENHLSLWYQGFFTCCKANVKLKASGFFNEEDHLLHCKRWLTLRQHHLLHRQRWMIISNKLQVNGKHLKTWSLSLNSVGGLWGVFISTDQTLRRWRVQANVGGSMSDEKSECASAGLSMSVRSWYMSPFGLVATIFLLECLVLFSKLPLPGHMAFPLNLFIAWPKLLALNTGHVGGVWRGQGWFAWIGSSFDIRRTTYLKIWICEWLDISVIYSTVGTVYWFQWKLLYTSTNNLTLKCQYQFSHYQFLWVVCFEPKVDLGFAADGFICHTQLKAGIISPGLKKWLRGSPHWSCFKWISLQVVPISSIQMVSSCVKWWYSFHPNEGGWSCSWSWCWKSWLVRQIW